MFPPKMPRVIVLSMPEDLPPPKPSLPPWIEIQPSGLKDGQVQPPGSKSITNRALICAALARGTSRLTGVLDSDDTRIMVQGLDQLGIAMEVDFAQHTITVHGCGGKLNRPRTDLFVGNSGTTVRFLTAMVSIGHGQFRLDGVPRMRERPIQDLLDALQQLGVDARAELGTNCPPVIVDAHGMRGGHVRIRGAISSQFLSGLAMAAPYADGDVTLHIEGELVSQPYVRMTSEVMRSFGARVEATSDGWRIVHQPYVGCEYEIEPDASAASYFWGAAAITGGKVTVCGLSRQSLQGDVKFCNCLARMGCQVDYLAHAVRVHGSPRLHGIEVDMNGISDTVQTLAVVALFADSPTTIHGVAHIRHKETDRIGDLARELRKLGATIEEFDDGMRIEPGPLHGAAIETYDDHRMAMSLALAGLRVPGVIIHDPGCTSKTYPYFFRDLAALTAS